MHRLTTRYRFKSGEQYVIVSFMCCWREHKRNIDPCLTRMVMKVDLLQSRDCGVSSVWSKAAAPQLNLPLTVGHLD